MLDGRLISAFMPGASTEAAFTGFSGIFACFTSDERDLHSADDRSLRGGGEEHSLSLQETASPSSVARRRDM